MRCVTTPLSLSAPISTGNYRKIEVCDFTSMYDKFVHSDMKSKLRKLTTLVFEYMKGNDIFTELDEFTGRRRFKDSGHSLMKLESYTNLTIVKASQQ
jgi:hypothetical protein